MGSPWNHSDLVEPKSHKTQSKHVEIQLKSPIIIIIIIMIFSYFLRKKTRVLLHPIPSRYGSRLPGTPGERPEGGGPATAGDPGRRREEENHISRRGSMRRSMCGSIGALVPSQLAVEDGELGCGGSESAWKCPSYPKFMGKQHKPTGIYCKMGREWEYHGRMGPSPTFFSTAFPCSPQDTTWGPRSLIRWVGTIFWDSML